MAFVLKDGSWGVFGLPIRPVLVDDRGQWQVLICVPHQPMRLRPSQAWGMIVGPYYATPRGATHAFGTPFRYRVYALDGIAVLPPIDTLSLTDRIETHRPLISLLSHASRREVELTRNKPIYLGNGTARL